MSQRWGQGAQPCAIHQRGAQRGEASAGPRLARLGTGRWPVPWGGRKAEVVGGEGTQETPGCWCEEPGRSPCAGLKDTVHVSLEFREGAGRGS